MNLLTVNAAVAIAKAIAAAAAAAAAAVVVVVAVVIAVFSSFPRIAIPGSLYEPVTRYGKSTSGDPDDCFGGPRWNK